MQFLRTTVYKEFYKRILYELLCLFKGLDFSCNCIALITKNKKIILTNHEIHIHSQKQSLFNVVTFERTGVFLSYHLHKYLKIIV